MNQPSLTVCIGITSHVISGLYLVVFITTASQLATATCRGKESQFIHYPYSRESHVKSVQRHDSHPEPLSGRARGWHGRVRAGTVRLPPCDVRFSSGTDSQILWVQRSMYLHFDFSTQGHLMNRSLDLVCLIEAHTVDSLHFRHSTLGASLHGILQVVAFSAAR
ncbi:hypothetical protein CALCODRAFT_492248 [Calocera cornea HHB12733]|uniref:Uncharacterized protein n=1 Tax=Calocera cornea HHB12733 TaxID=1353952 RepID=A0A165IKE1_9BASI|nr:hypothetical protein CALCODRAFT_492248 [Calocera cornea HHB12733]